MSKLAAAVAATCLFLLPSMPVLAQLPLPILFPNQEDEDKERFRTWEVRDVDGDFPITDSAIADLNRHLKARLRLPNDMRGRLTMQVRIYQGQIVATMVTRSDEDLEAPIAILPLKGHLMAWRAQEPLDGNFKLRLRTIAFREEAPTIPPVPTGPARP